MKKNSNYSLKLIFILLALLLIAVAVLSGIHTYKGKLQSEHFDEIDRHSMFEFSQKNTSAAINAIKSGDSDKLAGMMVSSEGLDKFMSYADWSSLDTESIVSMGSGSMSSAADKKGRIDVADKFVIENADGKYVFYVETLASRWGRKNEGISAISVTGYDHFNDLEFVWNGESDESTVTVGKMFWPGNDKDSVETNGN